MREEIIGWLSIMLLIVALVKRVARAVVTQDKRGRTPNTTPQPPVPVMPPRTASADKGVARKRRQSEPAPLYVSQQPLHIEKQAASHAAAPQPAVEQPEEARAQIVFNSREYNIADAVIMSEILTPKFRDDELG